MQPGDAVQILQTDHAILIPGGAPTPAPHWIYAVVLDTLKNDAGAITAAHVEVNHPANFQHGQKLLVPRKNLRTFADLQALHDAHPAAGEKNLSYDNPAHKDLINYRAALERCAPPKEDAAV